MKKKTINRITLGTALTLGAILLIGCTANFATNNDRANIMYAYDMGTTRYFKTQQEADQKALEAAREIDPQAQKGAPTYKLNIDGQDFNNVWCFQDFKHDYRGNLAVTLDNTNKDGITYALINNGIAVPSAKFWRYIDNKVLVAAWDMDHPKDPITNYLNDQNLVDKIIKDSPNFNDCGALVKYGAVKYKVNEDLDGNQKHNFNQLDQWTKEAYGKSFEGKVFETYEIPSIDFVNQYQAFISNKANNIRSCIIIGSSETYGRYGNFGWGNNHYTVWMQGKNWGSAWGRGFLEGLLVYPVAAMTEIFSHSFGMGGWGQLGAILCVTFIVRTILLLVSLKSTIGQQKMQMLQPELAKIQAKYPNANTNRAQKQRMGQEQMALYKKNHINPIGTLLVLIVQFPLFIAVWGGLQGSAALATDSFLNLYLSESIWNTLVASKGLPSNSGGWWTAFALVILMAVGQFVSMKLPQWMQKHREKKQPKLTANPQANKTQRQMKWFGYIMLVIIIIMGFTLPAGMGVYWLAGALYSIIQTVVIQFAMNGTFKKQGYVIKRFFTVSVPKLFKKGNKDSIDVDTTHHDKNN